MTDSLLAKLKEASDVQVRKCKYAQILETLDKETQDFIEERMTLPTKHPNKLSYATLARVLRSEDKIVGSSTIGDHYTALCACHTNKESKL